MYAKKVVGFLRHHAIEAVVFVEPRMALDSNIAGRYTAWPEICGRRGCETGALKDSTYDLIALIIISVAELQISSLEDRLPINNTTIHYAPLLCQTPVAIHLWR